MRGPYALDACSYRLRDTQRAMSEEPARPQTPAHAMTDDRFPSPDVYQALAEELG